MIRVIALVTILALGACRPSSAPDCRPSGGGIGGTGAAAECEAR